MSVHINAKAAMPMEAEYRSHNKMGKKKIRILIVGYMTKQMTQ